MGQPQTGGIDITARAAAAAAQSTADGKAPSVPAIAVFPAAASDTVQEPVSFPFDGSRITRISVAPVGAAGTGTLTAKRGVAGAGNNMLSAASFDLSTLTGSTATDLTLTGTQADLDGDAGDYLQIEIDSGSVPHIVSIDLEVAV